MMSNGADFSIVSVCSIIIIIHYHNVLGMSKFVYVILSLILLLNALVHFHNVRVCFYKWIVADPLKFV